MKTLYITDLDGTLLDSRIRVSETSADLLNRAIASGALVSVATARTPATLSILLRDVRLRLPMVVMTGAALWHRDDNRYSDICTFPPEKVEEIRATYSRYNLPTFIYTLRDNRLHIYHQGPLSDYERNFVSERLHSPFKRFHLTDPVLAAVSHGENEIPADSPVAIPDVIDNALLFFGMQNAALDHPAYIALRKIKDINAMIYPDANIPEITMIEAFARHATKAEGIRRLKRIAGADRVVVFGDNLNDLPMFDEADVAVAVANALPEVRRRADIVIGSHDEDSVARFILDDYLSHTTDAPKLQF